ncbi:MAG: DNA (cytosine-5-)-methyltransferase [Paludibacteraceae bacterium]|nr:DNA (cytosine-5-)-methyltransferase [Paludibacteraceae bacterium]
MPTFLSATNLADLTGTSLATTQKWGESGVYPYHRNEKGKKGFYMEELTDIETVKMMLDTNWEEEFHVAPLRDYTSVELFAGAGGLAIGMHLAGFRHVLLNEIDPMACQTLRRNHPEWNVLEGDIRKIDFSSLRDKVDFLSGGFPCQAFSYAGKKGGLNDTRGTLFFELARAVKEIRPKVFMGENVKGLLSHDEGRTLEIIRNAIAELGYTLVEPRILKAIMYQVPQKRERLILIAIRNDIYERGIRFTWPDPYHRVMTLRDAFFSGELFDTDVPKSEGQLYPAKKARIMAMVPEGGDWRDLPIEEQKEYMGGSFYLGGGKTGMARRLSMDEPSLTLTCAPAQKQTERCHPIETRPLTVREYARIQTFPDNWVFEGNMADQYKQIGNAVPVNLAFAIGRSLIRLFNEIDANLPENSPFEEANRLAHDMLPAELFELDMFNMHLQYSRNVNIVDNQIDRKKHTDNSSFDDSKNVLVCLVPDKYIVPYTTQKAKVYFSGKKFPSTVKLNKLYYFMPYTKGKGIRDLYQIVVARVGSKHEFDEGADENDFRIVFEIKFIKQLFDDFKPIKLTIWRTFTDTNLRSVLAL